MKWDHCQWTSRTEPPEQPPPPPFLGFVNPRVSLSSRSQGQQIRSQWLTLFTWKASHTPSVLCFCTSLFLFLCKYVCEGEKLFVVLKTQWASEDTQSIHAEPSLHAAVSFPIFLYYFKTLMSLIKNHLIQMNLFLYRVSVGSGRGNGTHFCQTQSKHFSLLMFNSHIFNI